MEPIHFQRRLLFQIQRNQMNSCHYSSPSALGMASNRATYKMASHQLVPLVFLLKSQGIIKGITKSTSTPTMSLHRKTHRWLGISEDWEVTCSSPKTLNRVVQGSLKMLIQIRHRKKCLLQRGACKSPICSSRPKFLRSFKPTIVEK